MRLAAHGFVCYSDSVPMSAWGCAAPATMVYYNTYKQPLPANSMSFYAGHVDKESGSCNANAQPAVDNLKPFYPGSEHQKGFGAMRDCGFYGCRKKTEENSHSLSHLALRLRSKKRDRRGSYGERLWVPKQFSLDMNSDGAGVGRKLHKKGDGDIDGDDVRTLSPSDNKIELEGKTSLMIKNIPNQFQRHDLLRILDKHCLEENRKAKSRSDPFKSEYDFLYLPMDFRNHSNLGYAFVNFTNAVAASRFCKTFNKYEWEVSFNKKTCEISCAVIQGREALRNHFKNSVFYCHTNGYLPVVLSPPRDGLVQSRPVVVGRRAVGPSPPGRGAASQKKP
ncbi:hypothetical protein GH714_001735 [Hevea brasiliensis]|uniref:Mei2-like C-terminal RNA recognition motif domain-containing protein n=1 Tax=Hevea brasiliensis TaxID=3981 RepID=A0A6A6L5W8_HEVBR|nr:hypothetical protein GH714_001735 [Hevea brasiliensis]